MLLASAAPATAFAEDKPAKPPEAPAKPQVEYGEVDAATVRVFSIGTVDLTHVQVRGRQVSVATPTAGHGSGFVTGAGIVVTAFHVVDGARHIVVRLPGEGGFYAARLLHQDKDGDVAVLKIDATPPVLDLAAGSTLRVRQTVYAIGYPLDPRRTQAQSARGIVAGQKDTDTIQLDMALNPGNSGGPLVDEQDRVVGMVVARGNPEKGVQGIGFAVSADRLLATIKEGQRRLDAGQVADLTDIQRQSAVVVDELVQQGVFHEIRETGDLKEKLKSADVQKALDALIARIEDPDLLVFVGAQLWNVYLALWAADREDLAEAKITQAVANDLANRFGYTAGAACRKARELDPDVAARSPIVNVVLATWRDSTPPPGPPTIRKAHAPGSGSAFRPRKASTPFKWPSFNLTWITRASGQLRLNPETGSFGLGFGFGLAFGLDKRRFEIGGLSFLPMLGVGWGRAELFDDTAGTVVHSYLTLEVGVVADVWSCRNRHVEVAAVYAPGSYGIAVDPGGGPGPGGADESDATWGHARVAGGYRWGPAYLGAAVHVFEGPTLWFEPAVLAVVF